MSKSKQEHVEYWVRSSKEDLDTAIFLFSGKRWLYGLFCCHLAIEKICKVLWVKSKVENIPPKTHNLLRLLAEAGISYDDDTGYS